MDDELPAPRKHWWQGSLRPALSGLTTGVIHAGAEDCELVLDLQRSELHARTGGGEATAEGDDTVPKPYCYVTAYPLPDAFPSLPLPAGTTWRTAGFNGAVLPYHTLIASRDPHGYLLDLWNGLLLAGRRHMLASTH